MRPYWIRISPILMTDVFIERGKFGHRDTQRRMLWKADIRVLHV